MKSFFQFLSITLALVLLHACAGIQPANEKQDTDTLANALTGKLFVLAGYESKNGFVPIEPEHGGLAALYFENRNTINGHTGINRFSASWTINPHRRGKVQEIRISPAGITKMGAPSQEVAEFERRFLELLDRSRQIETGRDSFILLDTNGKKLLHFIWRERVL